ncbi:MAG: hypothetical protein EOO46_10055 [Flavobacterium sp.]|nr:MAG: hypothetical protein EOO46_10055 [Flavobacterium sp.]
MINVAEERFKTKTNLVRKTIVFSSGILLMVSLTQNAYYIEGMRVSIGSFGLIAFLLGWLDFNYSFIVWLANPLLILSWFFLFYKQPKQTIIPSTLAVLFSLSFLLFENIIANEGGGKSKLFHTI